MGLTIKAVLHEEVYYFANRVCLDINDSDFEEELNKLAAADVRRRSLRSLCEPSGNITSQLLDGPLRPSKLRSSCNHLPLLPSQVKRDKLEIFFCLHLSWRGLDQTLCTQWFHLGCHITKTTATCGP